MFKGYIGETKTKKLNNKLKNDFYIINGLTIKKSNNETTQIDHVLISKNTSQIYVVETKNYNGEITGIIEDREWNVRYGDKNYKMYNPFFQNYSHIKIIQSNIEKELKINIPIGNFHSIIYSNGNAEVNLIENNKNDNGMYLFNIKTFVNTSIDYEKIIKEIETEKENIKNKTNSKEIFEYLNSKNLTNGFNFSSLINSYKHIKQIKEKTNKI